MFVLLFVLCICYHQSYQTQVEFTYSPMRYDLPKFVQESDKKMFLLNPDNTATLGQVAPTMLYGRNREIRDAHVTADMTCSWAADDGIYALPSFLPACSTKESIMPVLIGDGSLQSTIVDVLPKLAQASSLLINSPRRYQVLVMPPASSLVEELIGRMAGVETVAHQGGVVKARNMLLACHTPPMHSTLWDEIRRRLAIRDQPSSNTADGHYIILVLNTHTSTRGRDLINKVELIAALKQEYGPRVKVFHQLESLDETIALFSQASVVIGVTGPSMANIIFSPRRTRIVEISPTLQITGTVLPSFSRHELIWKMASTLRMSYWRRPEIPLTSEGNVIADLELTLKAVRGEVY